MKLDRFLLQARSLEKIVKHKPISQHLPNSNIARLFLYCLKTETVNNIRSKHTIFFRLKKLDILADGWLQHRT